MLFMSRYLFWHILRLMHHRIGACVRVEHRDTLLRNHCAPALAGAGSDPIGRAAPDTVGTGSHSCLRAGVGRHVADMGGVGGVLHPPTLAVEASRTGVVRGSVMIVNVLKHTDHQSDGDRTGGTEARPDDGHRDQRDGNSDQNRQQKAGVAAGWLMAGWR